MRYALLLLASLLTTAVCYGQKNFIENEKLNGVLPLSSDGSVTYQVIDSVPGATKDQLFRRARKWFTTNYNSAKDVLQVNDIDAGELIGKGIFDIKSPIKNVWVYPKIGHTITVEIKEARYRITVGGLVVNQESAVQNYKLPFIGTTKNHYTQFYQSIDQKVRQTLESIHNALTKSSDF